MERLYGYIGIIGVIASMALSPIAETLPLSGLQLAFLRGLPGVVFLLLLASIGLMKIKTPDRNTLILSCCFAIATVGVFNGIKTWGANPTIILLDLAVLVPIVIGMVKGVRPHKTILIAFLAALLGSFLSLQIWNTEEIVLAGLGWGLLALLFNGLFIEYAGKSTQDVHTKVFWQSALVCLVSIFAFSGNAPILNQAEILTTLFLVLAMGICNFYLAFLAFANLNRVIVGVLILAITPATIISSFLLLGKSFGLDQVIGVIITLTAVWYLGKSEVVTRKKED